MFRAPSCHPREGPPRQSGPYPAYSLGMDGGGAPFASSAFAMHGRGGFHLPFHGGPYQTFSPSGPLPSVRPPPPTGSPPLETPPPPPIEGNFRPLPMPTPPPPPPIPKDPEMLKNIEVLSSFVVKNGPQFENMARAKQAGDPKFAFLFGGDKGTDAALGFDFYNWKKDQLVWVDERTRVSPAEQQKVSEPTLQGQYGRPSAAGLSHESPGSPAGSDMDMEDDFVLPVPSGDTKPGLNNSPSVPPAAVERKRGLSPTSTERKLAALSPARDWKPQFSSPDRRPELSLLSTPGGKIVHSPRESVELKAASPVYAPVDRNFSQKDTRQRTGFDRPRIEDASPQCSPGRAELNPTLPALDPDQKGALGNGNQEGHVKPSRWGPKCSSERLSSGVSFPDKMLETGDATDVEKGNKKSVTSAQKRVKYNSTKDRCHSPDVAAKLLHVRDCNANENEILKLNLKSGLDQPAVDEFGRLLHQGSSDSDDDDNHHSWHKKLRRTLSRSTSGSSSPRDMRFKHWSPGHSPHRPGRRSRSRSCSPSRNWSHTPVQNGRRGREGVDDCGTLEEGGRRGGRGVRLPPRTCFDFVKGNCFRGSSCRFLHEESHGAIVHQGRRWMEGQGRGREREREQGHSGRTGEGERKWGGRSGDNTKLQRPWECDDRAVEDDSREMKLISKFKRQEHELSTKESLKQEKGFFENPVKSSEESGQTENDQLVKSSSEPSLNAFTPSSVPSLQCQPCISTRLASQAGQQIMVLSQQQSPFSTSSVSANHNLGSLVSSVSQKPSFMVSDTPHSQELQFSPVPPSQQPPAFLKTLQPQKSGYQSLPGLSQSKGFASSTLHLQPALISGQIGRSGSPPLPKLQTAFPAVLLGRSETFNPSQQPILGPFPNSCGDSGFDLRLPMASEQTHILPSPLVQNLHTLPGQPWIPGAMSYPLGPPQPLQQPPPQLTPPKMSATPTALHSYTLPISYPMPSCSSLSSKIGALRQPCSMNNQYDPLADSLEPAPLGFIEKKGLSNNQSALQGDRMKLSGMEQWRQTPGGMLVPMMTIAGEVVLENVSPGLPGHVDNGSLRNGIMGVVSPILQPQVVMENVSHMVVSATLNGKDIMKVGGLTHQVVMENISPSDHPREAEGYKESAPETEDKKSKKRSILNLIRKAVAEHVKDLLKPTWKGGQMSKEAFKTIAKKAVYKVMGALEGKVQILKTQENVDVFMKTSKPKIAKLVQGYVDKYVKV